MAWLHVVHGMIKNYNVIIMSLTYRQPTEVTPHPNFLTNHTIIMSSKYILELIIPSSYHEKQGHPPNFGSFTRIRRHDLFGQMVCICIISSPSILWWHDALNCTALWWHDDDMLMAWLVPGDEDIVPLSNPGHPLPLSEIYDITTDSVSPVLSLLTRNTHSEDLLTATISHFEQVRPSASGSTPGSRQQSGFRHLLKAAADKTTKPEVEVMAVITSSHMSRNTANKLLGMVANVSTKRTC